MKVLRTPDARFEGLADWPFQPRYSEVTDADGTRLRIHYVDEGPRLKRFAARAKGRGTRIVKRTSHITVVVGDN